MSNKYDDAIAKVWERSHFERATKLLERVEAAALYAKERNMPDTLRVLRAAIDDDQRLEAQRRQRIRSIMHQPAEPQQTTDERMSDTLIDQVVRAIHHTECGGGVECGHHVMSVVELFETVETARVAVVTVVRALRDKYTSPAASCETAHTSMSRSDFDAILIECTGDKK